MRPRGFAAALSALVVVAQTAGASGDAVRGETVFQRCLGCHQVGEGARNRTGPHLNGVVGRAAAEVDDYNYSEALRQAATDGLKWTDDALHAFLENPAQNLRGTRMTFPGLKGEQDRADVIAYLRGFPEPSDENSDGEQATEPTDQLDPAILAINGDPKFGEYLSGECTTCHRADGIDAGIPSIVLLPEEKFVAAMHAYRIEAREHPVMNMIAGRLSDEEIAALAAYFATLQN